MQTRLIMLAVVLAASAVIWAVPRTPSDFGQADAHEDLSGQAVEQRATERADGSRSRPGPVQAPAFAPGEVQRDILELLVLRDDDAPPADLLSLAELIYFELLAAGPAAVPEALDFLFSGEDLPLAGRPGADFDFQSLRLALIDAMRRIGGSEVERAFLAELQRTESNAELEALADALEWLQPGVHRDAILDRATTLLADLETGPGTGVRVDTAPLFRVLQDFGGPGMTAVLQGVPYWLGDYAEVALAKLPHGQGLEVLERLARRDLRRSDDSRALHLLAQLAASEQGAELALFELALAGGIPDQAWPLVAEVLMGDRQLQLEEPPLDPLKVGSLRGSNPFAVHTISDRQVQSIYSVNYSAVLPPHEAARRLALINRLLEAPISPAARGALWAAYDLLNGRY